MIRKVLGVGLVAGWMLGLPSQSQGTLPACTELAADEGLHWECSDEELLGSLVQTLKLYAEHLTAALRNPPRDIQLLLYNYKQEQSTMPIGKSYRIYKEQLMLPTEEILNPWDFSFGGDGPIFFINRKSPETIYFLEAPKKDPECDATAILISGLNVSEFRNARIEDLSRLLRQMFAEDAPLTQGIERCYSIPLEVPVWKYIAWFINSDLTPRHKNYHLLNNVARNRIKYLPERDLNVRDERGHWIFVYALETEFDSLNYRRIFHPEERGFDILIGDVTWDDWFEHSKFVVGTVNLPIYTSEFPFEQYIKNNATLWRPQELGAELSPEFDYLQPWPFIDLPVWAELSEPVTPEQLKTEFPARFSSQLEELRQQLETLGADASILDVQSWRFEMPSEELPPGSYLVTVDGTLELTDPSQPASEVFFREIVIALEPMEP